MKFALIFSAILMFALVMGNDEEDRKAWEDFKVKFNKSYNTTEEDENRYKIFLDNKKHIEEHNKKYEKGESSYSLGINHFSDMTHEEWKNTHLGKVTLDNGGLNESTTATSQS